MEDIKAKVIVIAAACIVTGNFINHILDAILSSKKKDIQILELKKEIKELRDFLNEENHNSN